MKFSNSLLSIVFGFVFLSANAQLASRNVGPVTTDSVTRVINIIGEQFVKTPGHYALSIGLIRNGKDYSYNFGTIEYGRHTRPTNLTIYEIASVTKSFTGILLAHAILEKRIGLKDNIQQYLPKPFPNLTYKGIPITIEDLATHTSGLPKFIPGLNKDLSPDQLMKRYEYFSAAQFLNVLSGIKLDTIPGTKFIYSNADAQLIGIILAKIYHSTYANLLKKYITGPQQMNDTKLEIKGADTVRFAKGYNSKGEVMPRLDWWRMTPAAGYIKSDISDMLKYLQMNMDEGDTAIKLAHQSIFDMNEEGAQSIGLFWFTRKSAEKQKVVYHAGGSFGTTSYYEVHPDQQEGIVLLTNDAGAVTENELKILASLILKTGK
ncbi:CubicO group peptidase (beta-lactamase class C family) [Mucilaginibacter frigoritolerans]|uniref:CubicO group peptidase (Beta-lactamase class C family) n=1 Tax=Mucilaginibacter frigoritolerans TaxID=652788 RepID=A0A562UCN6_9SPHI|nr:serine hydrolase domain-containing protein [Mucilaginibacter frigoritolerans]TWJ03329.1 CubicO group peptidase (beta-lactamase class C family) [Mucilaginibacter frigoritolerans]